MVSFDNKVAVITGASAGVGAATARALFAAGANLVLVARGRNALERLAGELGDADRMALVCADVGRPEDCHRLIEEAAAVFGRIDILINNAGCNVRGAVEHNAPDELAGIIDVNLRAPVLLSGLVLPHLRQAGAGAIVNVASLAGRVPLPDEASYSASKFGLRAFSLAMNQELRGSGITISVVSPGPIETGFILDDPQSVPDLVFSQPMSSAQDIADAIMACLRDGQAERAIPRLSGFLTSLGYLVPGAFRALRPVFERKGARVKRRLLARRTS